ncbi:hypothetical protein DFH08DRAFT_977491 [Mycena albidolilacea]|uniref:Fucose-specific lectin n=1 Tax=Mycena albidolilacea TaxID=1033008 RepID=A0AAD6Z0I8_9AGAR|nr:hypothetical protein DFH08DRAFT_977491 [Mycena albidolilacea]
MTDTVDFVLQLLDAALKAREYIQDFRDAPNDRRKLVSEMEDLQRQLRARITADPSTRIVQQMDTSLTALKCTMEELTLDLSPGKGQIARFTKQLTWSLWNKKEVGGYLVELERFKVLLNSWLMLDIWERGYSPRIPTKVPGYANRLDATTTSPVAPDAPRSSKSPSALLTRTATLATTAWPGGMRVYSQSGDGNIHEECLDQDVNTIGSPLQAHDWYHGTLKGSCAAGSKLCGMTWGSPPNPNRAIFYQTDDNVIHQMGCFHGQDWQVSSFAQADAMPGTHMAEVHNENAGHVVLFFQDKDNFLCSRRAIDWRWEDAVRLCQAAAATPISATTWSHTENIRVYFQNRDNAFQELKGSFDGGWTLGQFDLPSTKIHRSMAAISWLRLEMKPGPEIRMYIQDYTNTVIEWCYSSDTEWIL